MMEIFHDGHFPIKTAVVDVALQELPSGKLLGGIWFTVGLSCYHVHGGEGSFTDLFDHVVFMTARPGSFLSAPSGVCKIGSDSLRSRRYIRISK